MLSIAQVLTLLTAYTAIFIVAYVIGCLSYYFVFKAMGLPTGKAFIPIYNAYLLYSEYKGRVWKKNWGVAFLSIIFILPIIIVISFVVAFNTSSAGLGVTLILVGSVTLLAASVFAIMLPIVANWPLMTATWHKVVYIVLIVTGGFLARGGSNNSSGATNVTTYASSLASIFTIYVSYMVYKKVTSGEYKIVDKVDPDRMSNKEYAGYIASTGHCLIEKVTEKNSDKSQTEETTEEQQYV